MPEIQTTNMHTRNTQNMYIMDSFGALFSRFLPSLCSNVLRISIICSIILLFYIIENSNSVCMGEWILDEHWTYTVYSVVSMETIICVYIWKTFCIFIYISFSVDVFVFFLLYGEHVRSFYSLWHQNDSFWNEPNRKLCRSVEKQRWIRNSRK